MKKILFSFLTLMFLSSMSFADCCQKNIETDCQKSHCDQVAPENTCKKDKCLVDDDEYCVYNQCFFDKQYRKMKKELCLTSKQEACIDNIYRNFKNDMENRHAKYRVQKNRLLDMIECDNDCYKDQVKILKNMCKDAKEACKEYRQDVKDQLCKNQYGDYRRFLRHEKKKMKKLAKYGAIYKLPCKDCCK